MSEDRRNREAHRAARQQAYEDAALYHQVRGEPHATGSRAAILADALISPGVNIGGKLVPYAGKHYWYPNGQRWVAEVQPHDIKRAELVIAALRDRGLEIVEAS